MCKEGSQNVREDGAPYTCSLGLFNDVLASLDVKVLLVSSANSSTAKPSCWQLSGVLYAPEQIPWGWGRETD